jgi:hypothetical protein
MSSLFPASLEVAALCLSFKGKGNVYIPPYPIAVSRLRVPHVTAGQSGF